MRSQVKLGMVFMTLAFVLLVGPQFSQVIDSNTKDKEPSTVLSANEADPSISSIVSANTAFGFKLFNKIIEQGGEDNVFISPLSIATALAMAYNGAAGETEKVMAKTLELKDLSLLQINKAYARLLEILMSLDSSVRFKMANSIWADLSVRLRTGFADNIKEFFSAGIRNLDLSDPRSLELINRWAKEKTEGKVIEIVNKDDLDAILFIVNAVHFKGSWTVGFNEEDTQEGDFTLQDGSLKKVPMMVSQSESYLYYQGEGFQAVSLPYGNEKVSLNMFLPDRESSLKEFRMKLNRENWESWMSKFKKELVMVNLPRLKLENEITLNEVLKTLGMKVAFTPRADFTKMCFGSAFIDYVKHMSFAEINEEGTEASAMTIVKMKRGGKHVLHFDRPFFLAIRDNVTGSILFMGSIVDP